MTTLRQIERRVAEWVIAGLVREDEAPKLVTMVHRAYQVVSVAHPKITLNIWCDSYERALRDVDKMSPAQFAAAKRKLERAKKQIRKGMQ